MFALVALANYDNYYVYDSLDPVADLLQRQRGFNDSQIGILNAIYSLPNVALVLLGGILVNRFGSARMMVWTGAVCLAGALLTALSPGFTGAARGVIACGSRELRVAGPRKSRRRECGANRQRTTLRIPRFAEPRKPIGTCSRCARSGTR